MSLHKRDGSACLPGDPARERRRDPLLAAASYKLGGDPLELVARFTGISHGESDGKPLIFELGITGNPRNRDHEGLIGATRYPDEAACLDDFKAKIADLERAGATISGRG